MRKISHEAVKEIKAVLSAETFDAKRGASLYLAYGVNSGLARRFARNPSLMSRKIHWELSKMVGVTLSEYVPGAAVKSVGLKNNQSWPPVIDRIKAELRRIYPDRVAIQKELTQLGDSNDADVVVKARQLGEAADVLAARYEELNSAKEKFFDDGTVPKENDLFPEPEQPKDQWGHYKLSDIQLANRRRNLISGLTKDRNMLLYQKKTVGDKEDPMPAGKERDQVASRVRNKERELKAIEKLINLKV